MYHALLTNRYLTSRIIPFIAVAAVALCVALVIIVVSVMTGFLNMVKTSGRTLMGDVVVSYPVSGIPHYQKLIELIEQLPEAEAASPVVDGLCLLKMPYPDGTDKQTEMVQFWGIEPESFARVTGFGQTLHWREVDDDQWLLLFSDLVRRQWETIVTWLDDEQQFSFLRRVVDLGRAGFATGASDETLRRMIAEDDVDWEMIFYALSYRPEAFREILTDSQWHDFTALDQRLIDSSSILQEGLTLSHGPRHEPAIVMGLHVSEGNQRQSDGSYDTVGGKWWMPRYEVTLTTMPVRGGVGDPESRIFPIANEFQSGVFLIDDMRVMIPIDSAQRLTYLHEQELLDEDLESVIGVDPTRATMVLVRAAENVSPETLREAVQRAYKVFRNRVEDDPEAIIKPPLLFDRNIMTWEQQQAQFIGPVEKERELMRTLFSLVYVVCAGLVLSIFWAIVYEKTRDIGILRSVGASRLGISWIFLRYGLIVGSLGAMAGFGLGWLVVHNINVIHNAMGNPPKWLAVTLGAGALASLVVTFIKMFSGRLMPPVLGALVTAVLLMLTGIVGWLIYIGGVLIWNPEVYYFSVIPNQVDFMNAFITMIGAVLFSLVGAFLPAAKAADVDPVKALHYE